MMMLAKKKLISWALPNGAIVRPVLLDDVNSVYVDGLNDPSISQYLMKNSRKHTFESVKQYVEVNLISENSILFGLFINNSLTGTSRLHNIDCVKQTASLGIAIFDREIHGKGYGSSLISTVADFAINTLKLTCINAGINENNVSSEKAFRKAGFHYGYPYEAHPGCHIWQYKML